MAHKDASVPSGDESGIGSVTRLIRNAEAGDVQAQDELNRRFVRVVRKLADDKLGRLPCRIAGGMAEFAATMPDDPDFVLAEVMEVLFEVLDDDGMKTIARYKVAGWTAREIGEELGLTTKRVEFKWKVIRNKWKEKLKQMRLDPPGN